MIFGECANMQHKKYCIEETANSIIVSMKAEGFTVTDATRNACIAILSGKQSADTLVKELVDNIKEEK